MKDNVKEKILLFLTIFSIGIIFTYPTFTNTHYMNSFCTICNGYNSFNILMSNGYWINGLIYLLYNLLNIPYDSMSYISSFIANIFLSLSVFSLYSNIKSTNKKNNYILLICSFLIFYNPLIFDILLLDDGFSIAIGLFLVTLASVFINKDTVRNYIVAIILIIFASLCYYGILCYLIPLVIVINNDKKNLFKKVCSSLVIYIIGLICLFIISININFILFNNFNIIDNILLIFGKLIPNAFNLFNLTSSIVYYVLCLLVLGVYIYLISIKKNKKHNVIRMVLILIFSILLPFVPNLFINSNNNVIISYSVLPIASILSFIIIVMNRDIKLSRNYIVFMSIILVIVFGINLYDFNGNSLNNVKRYKKDLGYYGDIVDRIHWYENEHDYKIKYIYFAYDTNINKYYNLGRRNNNSNIRLVTNYKYFICGFNSYTDSKYVIQKMNDNDKMKYFGNKNYDEFDSKQLKFVRDKLFVLIY